MIIISHRGNIIGSNPNRENLPSYVDTAISGGWEVEVDIRLINGEFLLGHDEPITQINANWISERKDHIWFHCKNIDAAHGLKNLPFKTKFFCHSHDPYVITSTGQLWVHDLKLNLNVNTIIPLLTSESVIEYGGPPVFGICTDHVSLLKTALKNKGIHA